MRFVYAPIDLDGQVGNAVDVPPKVNEPVRLLYTWPAASTLNMKVDSVSTLSPEEGSRVLRRYYKEHRIISVEHRGDHRGPEYNPKNAKVVRGRKLSLED